MPGEEKLQNNESTRNVLIGIQFDRIGEIDTANEKFQADITIEAKWREFTIIDKYDPEVHWNPRLYVENSLQEIKDQIKYSIERDEKTNTSIITQRRNLKGVFWERIELNHFPFDVQQLSITVATFRDPFEIKLIENTEKKYFNMRVSKTFIDQQKWRLYKFIDVSQHASYDTSSLDSSSEEALIDVQKISASCYAARRATYYIWNAYFLIFLNTVVSLNTFAIDSRPVNNRLIPTFTLLLTSITFKWVVNRSLPAVGYLTALDKYEIASIFYLCLISVWHAIAGAFWESKELKKFEKWVLIAFVILFIVLQLVKFIWMIFIILKLRCYIKEEKNFLAQQKNFTVRKGHNACTSL